MNSNKLNNFVLVLISVGIIIYVFLCFREIKQTNEMEFRGVVQNVQYDIQGNATIMINDSTYKPRSNRWAFRGQIQKGNSLIKFKGSMDIKLIKKKTRNEMIFN